MSNNKCIRELSHPLLTKIEAPQKCFYRRFRWDFPLFCLRDSGGVRTHDPQLRRLLLYPTELRNQHYLYAKTKNNHRQNCIGQAFAMQM